ncbi:MAG: Tim44-like domain-containing protein [Candidatus Eremiobacteraeota bacterium]|nr:Tim44-like domain-containing protein [Candidatus Eremiobacteraeota bacterium]
MKISRQFISLLLIAVMALLLFAFFAEEADGRAGGGHSYSGSKRSSGGSSSRRSSGSSGSRSSSGSHSSGSSHSTGGYNSHSRSSSYTGGSSGSADCFTCFITLIVFAVIIAVIVIAARKGIKSVSTGGSVFFTPAQKLSLAEQIKKLKESDRNFSRPLFMDFIHVLYAKFQTARGTKEWGELPSYISRPLLEEAGKSSSSVSAVDNVVTGVSDILEIDQSRPDADVIKVLFEANYTEHGGSGAKPAIYYAREQWILERKKGVLSKPPDQIASLHCPSCGSPEEPRPDGTCPHCDSVVNKGDFHWLVTGVEVIEKIPRPPLELSGGGVEEGTDEPTVYQPGLAAEKQAFEARNPSFSWNEFEQLVKSTFIAIQDAWTSCAWEKARPYETEHLFSTHRYWIDRYRAEGLRNMLEDIQILKVETAKIEPDAYYESITMRIWARMKDYTIDSQGKVVDGNRNTPRKFSEYWTFIRRSGVGAGEKARHEGFCPNCGAELKVNMAGICEFCESKITSGEFGWVLSSIEQDEAYAG